MTKAQAGLVRVSLLLLHEAPARWPLSSEPLLAPAVFLKGTFPAPLFPNLTRICPYGPEPVKSHYLGPLANSSVLRVSDACKMFLRGIRQTYFKRRARLEGSQFIPVCCRACHQPSPFQADLQEPVGHQACVCTNSSHARNLPTCQVQFFKVPLQGHSVSL